VGGLCLAVAAAGLAFSRHLGTLPAGLNHLTSGMISAHAGTAGAERELQPTQPMPSPAPAPSPMNPLST
ncbi:unnamed protein product, partial [Symbiodinium sp. CCMP2592]